MRISDWSSDVCSSDLPCCRSRLSNSACRYRANIGSQAVAIEQLRGLPLQTAYRQKSFGDMAKVAWQRFAPLPIYGSGLNGGSDPKSVVSGKRVSVRVDLGGGLRLN